MDLRHPVRDAALVVIVCVAAMFLHPIAQGPYSAVHGPTTALRASHRSSIILTTMALEAFTVAARLCLPPMLFALAALNAAALILMSSRCPDPLPLRC